MAVWTFQDEANTAYYGRDQGGRWYWFGETAARSSGGHAMASSAHVFAGKEQADGTIEGTWWDVPKGDRVRTGSARFRLDGAPDGFGFPRLAFVDGAHPGRGALSSGAPTDRLDASPVPAGFMGNADSLTGTWISNSGAHYYVRELPDQVVWFGEKQNSDGSAVFSNVLVGRRSGTQVAGRWTDVPKGGIDRSGHLDLRLENPWTLRRHRVTGGFLDEWWHRVEGFWVDVCLFRLSVRVGEDDIGADEPLLWVAFFKQDGDWIDWTGHAGEPAPLVTVRPPAETAHRMWLRRMRTTDDPERPCREVPGPPVPIFSGGLTVHGSPDSSLRIPAQVGAFSTVLSTVRGFDPKSTWARGTTHLGFIAIAWDEDVSSGESTRAAYRSFRRVVREQLDLRTRRWFSWLVPGGSAPPTLEEIAGRAGREADQTLLALDSWATNSHDFIGVAQDAWNFSEFRDTRRQEILTTVRGDGAVYEIAGAAIPEFRALDPGSI